MPHIDGVESFRFVPRGVEVNGKEFVPYRELENCQEARERTVRAHTEAWEEIKRLREAIEFAHSEGFEWPTDPLPVGSRSEAPDG